MGEEVMRVTVLGAMLVLAAVLLAFVLIQALNQGRNRDEKESG